MKTNLHTEIERLAGDMPAVYVTELVLKRLALESLVSNLALREGEVFQINPRAPFVAKLVAFGTIADPATGNDPHAELVDTGSDIRLLVKDGLSVTVDIGFNGSAPGQRPTIIDTFSKVTMKVHDFNFLVLAKPGALTVEPAEATFIPKIATLFPDEEMESLALKHSVMKEDLYRIEGLVGFSGIQTQIALSVSQPHQIDLSQLFYGIALQGELKAIVSTEVTSISGSRALVLIPSDGIRKVPEAVCGCSGSDGGIGAAPGSQLDPETGQIAFGGIGPANPNKLDFGLSDQGDGGAGVYVPRSLASDIVDGVFPAIRTDFSDNGFVGFSGYAIADFGDLDFDFIPGSLELEVRLGFRLAANGRIHIDLGKLGKPKIGDFEADQGSATANLVVMRLRLAIEDGVVYLKPYIRELRIGSFKVDVNFFANVLSPFGSKGALVGFVFDRILEPVFAHNIPFKVRDAIKDYFADVRWKLVDAKYYGILANFTKAQELPAAITSMTNDSLLASTEWINADIPYPDGPYSTD